MTSFFLHSSVPPDLFLIVWIWISAETIDQLVELLQM